LRHGEHAGGVGELCGNLDSGSRGGLGQKKICGRHEISEVWQKFIKIWD
jgi:hypothetical protein